MNFEKYGFKSEEDFAKKIRELYRQGLSQRQIANQIGCNRHTIIRAFKIFNIRSRKGTLCERLGFQSMRSMIRIFRELYKKGLSIKEIAEKCQSSPLSVHKYLRMGDTKFRSTSESLAILQKDAQLDDEEIQVISGILLGNGYLKRNKYTASLHYSCLHEETTRDLIEKLQKLNPSYQFKRSIQRSWHQMKTFSYMCLASLYDKWYKMGEKKIPNDLTLTPEICYRWYIGDGASMPEALKLVAGIKETDKRLIDDLPVNATWYKAHNRFPTIYISEPKDRIKFLEYIGPCRHETYAYKWKIYAGEQMIADLSGPVNLPQ